VEGLQTFAGAQDAAGAVGVIDTLTAYLGLAHLDLEGHNRRAASAE